MKKEIFNITEEYKRLLSLLKRDKALGITTYMSYGNVITVDEEMKRVKGIVLWLSFPRLKNRTNTLLIESTRLFQ